MQVQSLGPLGPGLPESGGLTEKWATLYHNISHIYHTYITHIPTCFNRVFMELGKLTNVLHFFSKKHQESYLALPPRNIWEHATSEHDGFWGLD